MDRARRIFFLCAISCSLVPSSIAQKALSAWKRGYTTYYGGQAEGMNPNSPSYGTKEGSCGYGLLDKNSWPYWKVAGMSVRLPQYDGPVEGCGSCFELECDDSRCYKDASVKVVVTDKCPECRDDHIDLQALTFEQMAPPSVGNFYMRYRQVECTPPGPIQVQVSNFQDSWIRLRMFKVAGSAEIKEVQVGSGTGGNRVWTTMRRTWGATFELTGQLQLPIRFRLYDAAGRKVRSKGKVLKSRTPGVYSFGKNFALSSDRMDDLFFSWQNTECDLAAAIRGAGHELFALMVESSNITQTLPLSRVASILVPTDDAIETYVLGLGQSVEAFVSSASARMFVLSHLLSQSLSPSSLIRTFLGERVLETVNGKLTTVSNYRPQNVMDTALPGRVEDVALNGHARIVSSSQSVCGSIQLLPMDSVLIPALADQVTQPTVLVNQSTPVRDPFALSGTQLHTLMGAAGCASHAAGLGRDAILYDGSIHEDAVLLQLDGVGEFARLSDGLLLWYSPLSLGWEALETQTTAKVSPGVSLPSLTQSVLLEGRTVPGLVFAGVQPPSLYAVLGVVSSSFWDAEHMQLASFDGTRWSLMKQQDVSKMVPVYGTMDTLFTYLNEEGAELALSLRTNQVLEWNPQIGKWIILSLADDEAVKSYGN